MTDKKQLPDIEREAHLNSNLGLHVWQTKHAVERAMDEALAPLGMRVTQGAALQCLRRQPGLSGAELARQMHLTPQSVATLLAGFEVRGWVKRTPHPAHRGFREIMLTEQGTEILEKTEKIVGEVNRALSRTLNDNELALLHDFLRRVLKNAQSLTGNEAH